LLFTKSQDVKYYAAYLLYIFLFSNDIKRNNFLRNSEGLSIVPSIVHPTGSPIKPVPVLTNVAEGFLCPFSVHTLEPKYNGSGFIQVWDNYPSNERVAAFLTD
jgi:hypothetical protein